MHTGHNYPKNKMFAKIRHEICVCICMYVGPHYSNDKIDKL